MSGGFRHCELCFRRCGVNRLKGQRGYCASGAQPVVYSYSPHHGEEPPLSGRNGSGTIFFSRCNMSCVYCQNHKFSQKDIGRKVSYEELARIMLQLRDMGCHNINLVNPTHFVPAIVEALKFAYSWGLEIPVIYNTGGFDSVSTIRSLEGLVDIYLPDMRYATDEMAEKYSNAHGYVKNNRDIVKEMQRQVGSLKISGGIARKGLIIRLLILPGNISGTTETLAFIREIFGRDIYLSVMSQYYPAHNAPQIKELRCKISREEYVAVLRAMETLGLSNGWAQPFNGEFDERFVGENM